MRERGQTSVLIIGFAFVLLLMVGVVADASAAYLQRQGLDTLADGAALAGADEVRGSGVYEGGLTGERAPLDADAARVAVHDYLVGIGAFDEHPGLSFDVAVRDRSVIVRVTAPLDLPVAVGGVTDTRVDARGAAVVEVDAGP
ncbi:MAG: pilus assembly protein TadG-related protein [Nocardioides sp.]